VLIRAFLRFLQSAPTLSVADREAAEKLKGEGEKVMLLHL